MTKEDIKDFQKMINSSLMKFWGEVLEPVITTKADLNETRIELKREIEGTRIRLKSDINSVSRQIESANRKLDAEISYRDRLEKRVVRVENKLDLPHGS